MRSTIAGIVAPTGREGVEHLLFALLTVSDVIRQQLLRLLDGRPVRRQNLRQVERLEAAQRGEIVEEVAFGGIDHDGADARHQIAGEERAGIFQQEREVVEAVPRRVDRPQCAPANRDALAIGQRAVRDRRAFAAPGEHRRPCALT